MTPLLLDTKSAAEYIGVSHTQMEDYIRHGQFQIVRLPSPDGKGLYRKNLIYREELDRWVREKATLT